MPRESRHVWVGNLPENVKEEEVAEYFSRYGRVEKIKLLPKISPDGGRAAFVDFVDIRSATKANEAQNQIGGRDLRTNYNEPGHKHNQRNQHHHPPPPDYNQNQPVLHGAYPPPGLGYQRQVLIYAAPPQVDHVMHGPPPPPPHQFGPVFPRDDRRFPLQQPPPNFPPHRRSPGGRSMSDGDRSPSPNRRGDYSSGSDTNDLASKSTVFIKNLFAKGTPDPNLEEALYHEFNKYGDILNITIKGNGPERHAYVQFTKPEEAEAALHSNGKIFLGEELRVVVKATITPRPRERPLEDLQFDPHATRTVFVGNLDKTMMHGELRNIFERFGEVVDVDIKKMQTGITTYAFVQFIDINSATLAKRKMDRQNIGNNRVKVGYGRGTPTNSLWVGNLSTKIMEDDILKQFQPFGFVQRIMIDRRVWQALVRFETIDSCTKAFAEMHGQSILGKNLAVDYASPACRNAFYNRMERYGLLDRRQLEPSPTPPDSHINYQNASRGGPFQPRTGLANDIRPMAPFERYPERYEKDMRDSRPRERGYSPLGSPKRKSPSPDRKRRRSVSSPSPEHPPKKKDKKKKKEKKKLKKLALELGYHPDAPLKSKSELKKEKKERKKAAKARKKAEKKEKKLKKLQSLQDKLQSIEAAVKENNAIENELHKQLPNETRSDPQEPVQPMNNTQAIERVSGTETVSEISENESQGERNNGVVNENEKLPPEQQPQQKTSKSPVKVDDEVKNKSIDDTPASPALEPPPPPRSPLPASTNKNYTHKPSTSSSDSSSSSSSSSDSDDSSDSSDDDRSKRVNRKTARERDVMYRRSANDDSDEKSRMREPKAYRQDRAYEEYQRRDGSKDRYSDAQYNKGSSDSKDRLRQRSRSRSPYKHGSPYSRGGTGGRGRSPERRPHELSQRTNNDRYPPQQQQPQQKDPPPPPPRLQNVPPPASQSADTLMDLLCRFPVMWQGLLGLKNDTAAVQMHYLSGNIGLAETSLPRAAQPNEVPPPLRISQRMKLEPSQLEGVDKRIQSSKEHCMLLALPCGRDPLDVHAQTRALKTGFITYLQQKQAAGIINITSSSTKQPVSVIHIFPPCDFAQSHLVRVAPDLLDSAVESGHLMVLITPI